MNIESANLSSLAPSSGMVESVSQPLADGGVVSEGFSDALVTQIGLLSNIKAGNSLPQTPDNTGLPNINGSQGVAVLPVGKVDMQNIAALLGNDLPVSYNINDDVDHEAVLSAVTDTLKYIGMGATVAEKAAVAEQNIKNVIAMAVPAGQNTGATMAKAAPAGQNITATIAAAVPAGQDIKATMATAVPAGQDIKDTTATAAPVGQDIKATFATAVPVGQDIKATLATAAPAGQSTKATLATAVPAGQHIKDTTTTAVPVGQNTKDAAATAVPAGQHIKATTTTAVPVGQNTKDAAAMTVPAKQNIKDVIATVIPAGKSIKDALTTAVSLRQNNKDAIATVVPSGQNPQSAKDVMTMAVLTGQNSKDVTATAVKDGQNSKDIIAAAASPKQGPTDVAAEAEQSIKDAIVSVVTAQTDLKQVKNDKPDKKQVEGETQIAVVEDNHVAEGISAAMIIPSVIPVEQEKTANNLAPADTIKEDELLSFIKPSTGDAKPNLSAKVPDDALQNATVFRQPVQDNQNFNLKNFEAVENAGAAEKTGRVEQQGLNLERDKTLPRVGMDLAQPNKLIVDNKADVPAITKPLSHPEWNKDLGERIVWMSSKAIPTAEIRLNPQHLGPISVRVDVADDQATVVFTAQHAATREALEASIPKLREMMGAQQLNLVDVNVSQGSMSDQGRSQAQNFAQTADGRGQGAASVTANGVDEVEQEIESGRAVVSNGLLSIYA